MEHYIQGRVILGLLCLVHLFLNYAAAVGARRSPLNKKLLNGGILTELVLVTAYVIYDNIQTPPHDGWWYAIIGYIFVYGLIFMTWAVHCIYALLDENKVYEMTPIEKVTYHHWNAVFLRGTLTEDGHVIEVLLPWEDFKPLEPKHPKKLSVKFKGVLRGQKIIVALA